MMRQSQKTGLYLTALPAIGPRRHLDPDNDVDKYDIAIFKGCRSGSRILADPNCAK